MDKKTCRKCELILPIEQFHKLSRSRDGYASLCKGCKAAEDDAYRAGNRERIRKRQQEYRASNAEELKRKAKERYAQDPEKVKERVRKWAAENPEKVKDRQRKWTAENAEKVQERQKRWVKENAQRSREIKKVWNERNKAQVKVINQSYYAKNKERVKASAKAWREANPEKWREIIRMNRIKREARKKNVPVFEISNREFQKMLQSPCAVSGCTNTDIQIDHRVPLSKGGSHGVGNLQPLCGHHNASKNKRLWFEFLVYLRKYHSA